LEKDHRRGAQQGREDLRPADAYRTHRSSEQFAARRKRGGASAIVAAGEMYTDGEGPKPHPTPKAMTEADIKTAIGEFEHSAKNAVAAGIEGIELHGGNGYLLEQFIRPNSNKRTDSYGGSIENRARFVLDVVKATTAAIGRDKQTENGSTLLNNQ
jgi:2,4-dienoyl-CoA reductase-like NADH-dependent reductase (Old Yellow Enzyme family)